MNRPSALVPVIAGFSVMLLLMAAVTAIGVTYIRILSDQLTAIVAERNEKAELATAMHAIHQARFQALVLASHMDDPFLRDEEIMRFSRLAREFIQAREKFVGMPLDEAELNLWTQIRTEVNIVERHAESAIALLQEDHLDETQKLLNQEIRPLQESMMQEWGKLVGMQRAKNLAAMDEARQASAKARRLTIALSAGAFGVGLIVAIFVVRRSRRLEKDLFEEKEQAQVTLHSIADGVLRFDNHKRVHYLNPVAEQMLGIPSTSAMHQPLAAIMHLFDKADRNEITDKVADAALNGTYTNLPSLTSLRSASGLEYDVEGTCAAVHSPEGDVMGIVIVLRDVTEARETQRKLVWQAQHDSLTSLLNRRAFEESISQKISSKRTTDFPMSLLYVDLDHFKEVNDTAGHAAGDELLRQIAYIMKTRIRDTDILARMGGDEFAIALCACPSGMAEGIAQDICDSISAYHFRWEGTLYKVGASVGVVHVPPNWSTLDECLVAADAACYKAKQNGRSGVVVHETAQAPA